MFGASAASRTLTFSSLAASFSSLIDSHCCRSPSSYHTARHRGRFFFPVCSGSGRGGYTKIPNSSSITARPGTPGAGHDASLRVRAARTFPVIRRGGVAGSGRCGFFARRVRTWARSRRSVAANSSTSLAHHR